MSEPVASAALATYTDELAANTKAKHLLSLIHSTAFDGQCNNTVILDSKVNSYLEKQNWAFGTDAEPIPRSRSAYVAIEI